VHAYWTAAFATSRLSQPVPTPTVPVVCLEPVVHVSVGESSAREHADGEQEGDHQGHELCNVGGEQDEHDQATYKLPSFPAQRCQTLLILTALHDSEQDQGQDDDQWQQGGGHDVVIGRSRGWADP
jgi:hypothetical protein